HERLESALRQVKRSHERVVTTANEHYALSDGHDQLFSPACDGEAVDSTAAFSAGGAAGRGGGGGGGGVGLCRRRAGGSFCQSFRITWLAIRPGAPIIPPPGCVAEPHI